VPQLYQQKQQCVNTQLAQNKWSVKVKV